MMEHEQDIGAYRASLLGSLTLRASRSTCGSSDPIHVFVNQERVGLLYRRESEASLQVQTDTRAESVQLRSEDGVLLGGLYAPEYGFRSSRISLARDAIELRVHNTAHGGSVRAVFIPASSLWHRLCRVLAGVGQTPVRRPASALVPGMRAIAFTQALLAIILVGLATDRMTGWMKPEQTPPLVTPMEAPWAAPFTEVAKLEKQLDELARMQAETVDTIQAQQQGMVQLQQTMAKLSTTQETVASGLLTVKREMKQRHNGSRREIQRMTRLLMNQAQSEQEQLEAEIHSLTVANDRLTKEMADLEQNNEDLKKRLKSAGLDISQTTVSVDDKPMMARQDKAFQPSQSPQVAEARLNPPPQPFLFWVTFSDGTSQETIDQWVREMHGNKGALSEGWQAVEIVPPTEPEDRFLEQIKRAKIVKAVRTSR